MRYRLRTLLIATAWVGLVSLGLRTPSEMWRDMIAGWTLLTVLVAVLVAIYRTGSTRAMAVGFLVFSVGYLAYLTAFEGQLQGGLISITTPFAGPVTSFFAFCHPDRQHAMERDPNGPITQFVAFDVTDFLAVCNYAIACLLGVAGAIIAQLLHLTSRKAQ